MILFQCYVICFLMLNFLRFSGEIPAILPPWRRRSVVFFLGKKSGYSHPIIFQKGLLL